MKIFNTALRKATLLSILALCKMQTEDEDLEARCGSVCFSFYNPETTSFPGLLADSDLESTLPIIR